MPPPGFRIWATFEHAGHIYEAPADLQPDDAGPLDPRAIQVQLHPRDPWLSRVLRVFAEYAPRALKRWGG